MYQNGQLKAEPRRAIELPRVMTDDRCLPHLSQLSDVLQRLGARSVFAVVDAAACENSGAHAALQPIFRHYQVTTFGRFEPNPKFEDALSGLQEFHRTRADVVLAIGGGTAIDVAKLIAAGSPDPAETLSWVQKKSAIPRPSTPLIAVPTTSGTGSEATQFAVVYVEGVKYSVDHPQLLPAWCVLDPDLTRTLPPRITAQSGLDAFCQAIESIWSVRSSAESMADATEAARLAFTHLHNAVHAPTRESRAAMSRASHLAGRAINRTRTTSCHAISYGLTSGYGVAHGHAAALTLGPMLEYINGISAADCNDPRGVHRVQKSLRRILSILGCSDVRDGRRIIQNFISSLGCETRLADLGIAGADVLSSLARTTNVERLNNNPRRLSHPQLVELLHSIS